VYHTVQKDQGHLCPCLPLMVRNTYRLEAAFWPPADRTHPFATYIPVTTPYLAGERDIGFMVGSREGRKLDSGPVTPGSAG
jgi:hypothetical protein